MIRKFLANEGRILLEELGAPDARTLLRRVRFSARFYIKCGILVGGIAAVEEVFGLAAMWIVVAGVYLFHIWLLNRTGGGYVGYAEEMLVLMGDSGPSLPPPGKQALPPPSTPQIGRSNQALTKHRPALPKRGPD
jgi:hypothetical protein